MALKCILHMVMLSVTCIMYVYVSATILQIKLKLKVN